MSQMMIVDGTFTDPRWVDGRWDTTKFIAADGEVDWDLVSKLSSAAWINELISSGYKLMVFDFR